MEPETKPFSHKHLTEIENMKKLTIISLLTFSVTMLAGAHAQDIRYSSKPWIRGVTPPSPVQATTALSTVSTKPWLKSGPIAEAAFLPGKRVPVAEATMGPVNKTIDNSKPWLADYR